jgi:hypothetical protein
MNTKEIFYYIIQQKQHYNDNNLSFVLQFYGDLTMLCFFRLDF